MIVTSVDVGYLHLAFVCVQVVFRLKRWYIQTILCMEMINITEFHCPPVCTLHHTKSVTDYLMHIIQRYPWFDQCDVLLVERQPIHGIKTVEEFFLHQYRDKTELIHPIKVHRYFGIHRYEGTAEERRDQRKAFMVRQTVHLLSTHFPAESLDDWERKHDVADAWMQLLFWLVQENKRINPTQSKYFLMPTS